MTGGVRIFLTASGARASVACLAVVRAKAVALLLGPEGVGLLGLFTAAQEIGAQAADAGLSHSAVREVARTRHDPVRAARLRRALAIAVLGLATIGALIVWTCRAPIARSVTGADGHATAFGILALGLFLTVLFRWRQALLTGYGLVGPLSGALVAGTALSTLVACVLVAAAGMDGLVWAVVAAPAAGLLALLAVRCPRPARAPPPGRLGQDWSPLIRLGLGLMLVAQMALVAPMLVRIWLTHQSGLAEAGLFQAAWTISAQAITVLLTAGAMDFYPRLSALSGDRDAAARCLADQIGLNLAIGGPVLLALTGLAQYALIILYAPEFAPAAALLQGLAIGGIARLVAAPLETVLTVAGRARLVVLAGLASLAILLAGTWFGYPRAGLAAIGIAVAAANLAHLGILAVVTRRSGHGPTPQAWAWLAMLLAAAAALTAAPPAAAIPVAAAALMVPLARRYRFLGTTSSGGRRSAAALNRLKVWLT